MYLRGLVSVGLTELLFQIREVHQRREGSGQGTAALHPQPPTPLGCQVNHPPRVLQNFLDRT